MMVKSRKDILERTMSNLEFIEKAAVSPALNESAKVYEITQLVNSFLMTLLQNWDELKADWPYLKQAGLKWPSISTSAPSQQARQCIGEIRNALAHGLFEFEEGQSGDITALHLWTCSDHETVKWHAEISVEDMRQMLNCFVQLAKQKDLQLRRPRQKGQPRN